MRDEVGGKIRVQVGGIRGLESVAESGKSRTDAFLCLYAHALEVEDEKYLLVGLRGREI